jgi:hypothetical protein
MIQLKYDKFSAVRAMVTTIGIICGIAGLEHGFFEILQGNVPTEIHLVNGKPMIYAIGEANRFWQYGYEYAYTIIPNYLITGIAAMIFSSTVIICSIFYIEKKFGWLAFIILSVMQYLTGGGAAFIGLAIVLGIIALGINKPLKLWRKIIPLSLRQLFAKPWLILLVVFSLVFCQTIFTAVTGFFYGINDVDLINRIQWYAIDFFIILFPLLTISVFSYDSLKNIESKY